MLQGYNKNIDLKIDWSDLDLFGHVNNVAFFKYIQAARVSYCEAIGLTSVNENNKLSFIVAAINCDFKAPLKYPGNLKVYTKTDWIKSSSLRLSHIIVDENGQIAAESNDILVIFDYRQNTKTVVSNELKAQIEKLENKKL